MIGCRHGSLETRTPLSCLLTQVSKKKVIRNRLIQEAQGLGALLDKMEDNDHTNWITQRNLDVSFTLKPAVFETQSF